MCRLLAVAMVAASLDGFSQQSCAQQSGIQVDHVWSRAAMAGHDGAVYLTITDTGPPDTLTGVTTPVAAMADLHQSTVDNGATKMRPVTSLPIESGKTVTLAPGGYHIMQMDLRQPLKEGDSLPVTLSFAKARQVTATATVAKAGVASMPGMDHGGIPMQGSGKSPWAE